MITNEQRIQEGRLTANRMLVLALRFDGDMRLDQTDCDFENLYFSVTITVWPEQKVYVFATPWIRGWSVYVSDRSDQYATGYEDVPDKYKGLCEAVNNARGIIGPWNTDQDQLYDAVSSKIATLVKLSQARRVRYMQQHWPHELFKQVWGTA